MDKRTILQEIRRLAKVAGGRPPGRERFEKATGIRMADWYPSLWLRWGDALKEAGFSPNRFVSALDDKAIIESYIRLTRELGRLPVEGEVRLRARDDPTFPSHSVFSRYGGKRELIAKVRDYCSGQECFADVLALLPADAEEHANMLPVARAPIQGYVYLMRSGRRFKIGFTNSPIRRHREVKIELPERTDLVHSIETDDPRGIEAYWHRRFEAKRVRDTEFFELDASDVAAFKRRKYQ